VTDSARLREAVLDRLTTVIDPETGVNVVRMRLVEDLCVDESGLVTYRFRPSSPLCPIAMPLALHIQTSIAAVPGVTGQQPRVVGHILAAEITRLLLTQLKGDSPDAGSLRSADERAT
jgi:metal-sulfur cluster biosynthetic enzyme